MTDRHSLACWKVTMTVDYRRLYPIVAASSAADAVERARFVLDQNAMTSWAELVCEPEVYHPPGFDHNRIASQLGGRVFGDKYEDRVAIVSIKITAGDTLRMASSWRFLGWDERANAQ